MKEVTKDYDCRCCSGKEACQSMLEDGRDNMSHDNYHCCYYAGIPIPGRMGEAGWWIEDRLWASWLDGTMYVPH